MALRCSREGEELACENSRACHLFTENEDLLEFRNTAVNSATSFGNTSRLTEIKLAELQQQCDERQAAMVEEHASKVQTLESCILEDQLNKLGFERKNVELQNTLGEVKDRLLQEEHALSLVRAELAESNR